MTPFTLGFQRTKVPKNLTSIQNFFFRLDEGIAKIKFLDTFYFSDGINLSSQCRIAAKPIQEQPAYLETSPCNLPCFTVHYIHSFLLKVGQIQNDNSSSKKQINEFNFTTMIPQVVLFSFVFWKKLKAPKTYFKINRPLVLYSLGESVHKGEVGFQKQKTKRTSFMGGT